MSLPVLRLISFWRPLRSTSGDGRLVYLSFSHDHMLALKNEQPIESCFCENEYQGFFCFFL